MSQQYFQKAFHAFIFDSYNRQRSVRQQIITGTMGVITNTSSLNKRADFKIHFDLLPHYELRLSGPLRTSGLLSVPAGKAKMWRNSAQHLGPTDLEQTPRKLEEFSNS